MENVVLTSPDVAAAVMFGWERIHAGILIEPTQSVHNAAEVSNLRKKLWPFIEEANRRAPALSRIFKEMIIFTSPDKPLPRTGKRTVMRKAALKLYTTEINALHVQPIQQLILLT